MLPNGKYIISAFTLLKYFTKQMFKPNITVDTSKNVIIFGKYVTPALNIESHFAGGEPTNIVTA